MRRVARPWLLFAALVVPTACVNEQELGRRSDIDDDVPLAPPPHGTSPAPRAAETCIGVQCEAELFLTEEPSVTLGNVEMDDQRVYYTACRPSDAPPAVACAIKWVDKQSGERHALVPYGDRIETASLVGGAIYAGTQCIVDGTKTGCLRRVPTDGSAATTLVSGDFRIASMADDATHLYWRAQWADSRSEIRRVPLRGGADEVVTSDVESSPAFPNGFLGVDEGHVYSIMTQLRRAPKTGGAARVLVDVPGVCGTATPPPVPVSTAAVGIAGGFFWVSNGAIRTWNDRLLDSSAVTIASLSGAVEAGLTTDPSGGLVWASWETSLSTGLRSYRAFRWNPTDNSILTLGSATRDSTPPVTAAHGKRIAADAKSVFFSFGANTVYRVSNVPVSSATVLP